MRLVPVIFVAALGGIGCNSILGIGEHPVASSDAAAEGASPGAPQTDGATASSSGSSASSTSSSGSPSASSSGSGLHDAGVDAPPNSPGGPVAAALCTHDAGACVTGGIVSVARTMEAGTGVLPNGSVVTLTDDGFEFGATSCDTTGATCVTGAIEP